MNKTEYIKVLRELSNYFKSECINTDDFSKNVDDFFEDINYEKQNCSIKVIIESIISIICVCNDKNYISILLCLFILINTIKYHVCDSYEKSVINDYSIIDFCLKNYENQIKRIENAIEFFKDTNEEEVQKYLSYKMGDSKKIN